MLKRLWNSWKRLVQKIGNFQARVLLWRTFSLKRMPPERRGILIAYHRQTR